MGIVVVAALAANTALPSAAITATREDVQASVMSPNLDVAVVSSVPLIERFENVNLTPAEMKSPGHGHSAMVSMLLDVNTHFWLQGTFEVNASSAQLLSAAMQAFWQGLRSVCRC